MVETGEKISERIRLLYDPLYAIADIASQASDIQSVLRDDGRTVMPMLRACTSMDNTARSVAQLFVSDRSLALVVCHWRLKTAAGPPQASGLIWSRT